MRLLSSKVLHFGYVFVYKVEIYLAFALLARMKVLDTFYAFINEI